MALILDNVSAAKRVARESSTVIITEYGEPALALQPIAEYRRLTQTDKNPVGLLRMAAAEDFDIEAIRVDTLGLTA
ncbi:MAG: type II toxin-antitoxin system prevent-host-death family antitoxin [Ottowia sp.]|uniref:type II toxin-antitoxin system prevent-host-death family antitoxin n=1 Tax=Ottowia sp. TaxID=1898956 RepID=UPI0039E4303F